MNCFRKNYIYLSFVLPMLYWAFLLFNSQMVIVHDAIGFEKLGRLLHDQGWLAYFKNGPQREPLYPLIISFSMSLTDLLSISYTKVQAFFQLSFLLISQIFIFYFMNKMRVRKSVIFASILYFGLSPAMVNSALSLWSEVSTYPFILLSVFLASKYWTYYNKANTWTSLLFGTSLGISYIALISIRAVFYFIMPIIIIPFVIQMLREAWNRRWINCRNILVFAVSAVLTLNWYYGYVKGLNYKHNGHRAFTDRGATIVYGNAQRRTEEPVTLKRIEGTLSTAVGEGFCQRLFSKDYCYYWISRYACGYGDALRSKFSGNGLTPDELNEKIATITKETIYKHPVRYFTFFILEIPKLFFWESTRIGFVTYPPLLTRLFLFGPFKDAIRLFVALLSCISYLFIIYRAIKPLPNKQDPFYKEHNAVCLFIFLTVIAYSVYFGFVTILPRYVFPIVPLYFVAIGIPFINKTQAR